jgi:hypothetical protein
MMTDAEILDHRKPCDSYRSFAIGVACQNCGMAQEQHVPSRIRRIAPGLKKARAVRGIEIGETVLFHVDDYRYPRATAVSVCVEGRTHGAVYSTHAEPEGVYVTRIK